MADEDLLKRVPPHNIEAEMACLGAMMSATQAVDIVMETISEEDFYDEKNKIIFSVIAGLRESSDPIDAVTVSDRLESSRKLDKAGGAAYLAKLTESVPAFSNVGYYAKVVMEKSILRSLLYTSMEIADNVYQYQSDVGKVTNEAEQNVFNITSRQYRKGYVFIKDVINDTLKGIERLASSGETYTGVPTGFKEFDNLTSGLQRGDLIVLAARPSMGKTALSLNIAANIAKMSKENGILFFSLEMATQELMLRLLSSESKIGLQKIRRAKYLNLDDSKMLIEAASDMSQWKFIIDDTPAISIHEIRSKARRIVSREKINIIIVDHLQLVSGTDSSKMAPNRVQEISYISRNLKAIAKELNVPVLVLSQLSRAVESRQDKRPLLSDLRESGAIEQDADIVAFLYREEYYNKETDKKGITEFIIAKQRNGPTDTVPLVFLSDCVKFETADTHHDMHMPPSPEEPAY